MVINGTLKLVKEEQKVTDSFRKREFVVTDNSSPKYPQYLLFQATQDNCKLLDNFQPGEELKIQFNIKGREWQSPAGEIKYFNSLEAWKIERANERENVSSGFPEESNQAFPPSAPDQENDLPF